MSLEELLQKIRDKAIILTDKKIKDAKNDVTMLLVMILSEVYSLEYLIEEYLRTLDRLSKLELKPKTHT